jgi:D-tyrosyl-tRNA(Tyr) deacylase
MRLLVQRVKAAKVIVDGVEIGKIDSGVCLFLGVANGDTEESAATLAGKIAGLRIFPDESGKLNRSLAEIGGEVLVVSEFTLYGDCTKGRRPSFSRAAGPEEANRLYEYFVRQLKDQALPVATGKFQAQMEVTIVDDGPVTFLLDDQ